MKTWREITRHVQQDENNYNQMSEDIHRSILIQNNYCDKKHSLLS